MNRDERANFASEFLATYLSLGFGALGKSEVDTLVFHLITNTSQYKKMTNYQLANALKITETKVKNLRLSAALKYREINPKAILGSIVIRTMEGNQILDVRNGRLEIALEDPVEKRELENFLKSKGHSAEYTLNGEVLRIEPIRMLELMMENLDRAHQEFAEVVAEALNDQELSDRILAGNSTTRQLKRIRENVNDAETIVKICKGIAVLITAA